MGRAALFALARINSCQGAGTPSGDHSDLGMSVRPSGERSWIAVIISTPDTPSTAA